ncbi:MAG: hypothetical protein D6712_10365 [Chloroflexi bacterium]|nr:MAG: hypothetical protein D6712_10365 [Chloroflexota bacterium]
MTIDVERYQPHIYISRWRGVVTLEEVSQASQIRQQFADEDGNGNYVVILDAREVDEVPFHPKELGRKAMVDDRLLKFIVVRAPFLLKLANDLITMQTSIRTEFVDTFEEALERAQEILNET